LQAPGGRPADVDQGRVSDWPKIIQLITWQRWELKPACLIPKPVVAICAPSCSERQAKKKEEIRAGV
jgi:hypothetical protein